MLMSVLSDTDPQVAGIIAAADLTGEEIESLLRVDANVGLKFYL